MACILRVSVIYVCEITASSGLFYNCSEHFIDTKIVHVTWEKNKVLLELRTATKLRVNMHSSRMF